TATARLSSGSNAAGISIVCSVVDIVPAGCCSLITINWWPSRSAIWIVTSELVLTLKRLTSSDRSSEYFVVISKPFYANQAQFLHALSATRRGPLRLPDF